MHQRCLLCNSLRQTRCVEVLLNVWVRRGRESQGAIPSTESLLGYKVAERFRTVGFEASEGLNRDEHRASPP